MASAVFNGEADLRRCHRSFVEVAGWEARYYEACGEVMGCRCCREMAVGCLCEGATRVYDMFVARQTLTEAQQAYERWFGLQKALKRATNDADRRRNKREQRWLRQRNLEAERARAVALLDAKRYKEYATVDEAMDDGVFGYTPKKRHENGD